MVTGLVDTTVLVDMLRHYPPALVWFREQPSPGITPIVWMEVIAGAQNKTAQLQAAQLLAALGMVYQTQDDVDWAMRQLLTYALSHGIGIHDCLIASTCYRLQLPLYTHNRKHFEPLLGSLAQQPY